ncbi:hypothetical protein SteCoe_31211 [Stentor coeruleus]|uniref:Uncharacterized protein n=1 Tax=Stentor coeruleus TaxID=5963 RepID=A0A1R2B215_9CILI|nr:hypothetical protein SteCoe_31211 [Stentor coeruleus]
MGNCCDTVDSHLLELIQNEDHSSSTLSYSYDPGNTTGELYIKDLCTEELPNKFFKYRKNDRKLKTIIEDRQEDTYSPKFSVHKN